MNKRGGGCLLYGMRIPSFSNSKSRSLSDNEVVPFHNCYRLPFQGNNCTLSLLKYHFSSLLIHLNCIALRWYFIILVMSVPVMSMNNN